MAYARSKPDHGELIARAAFARLDVVALAVAMGCVFALGLWFATAMLLMKDTPPGVPIGPHLALLANFLPGYRVSWIGSLLGAFYGFCRRLRLWCDRRRRLERRASHLLRDRDHSPLLRGRPIMEARCSMKRKWGC